MNKDFLNQIPPEEQPIASTLFSVGEAMQVSPAFDWELETRLMNAAKKKSQPVHGWTTKIIPALGWALLAISAIYLISSTISSLGANQPAAATEASNPVISFESQVRAGNVCKGPLAVAHNFSVSLTNPDKTGFVILDVKDTIGELRSLTWSPDGKRLALVANTTGRGYIYVTDSAGNQLQPVISNSELGYLMDAAWSHDGKRLLTWSVENNMVVYLMNVDGTALTEKQLNLQIFETPQFTPDNESIVFYGADSNSSGLFEVKLDGSQTRMISALVEDEGSFAWSPDGLRLAYMEIDRSVGEARLVVEESANNKFVIAALPIPKGSGSSIPTSANLSWSADGKVLVFDFGRGAFDRVVYLAHADSSGLIKLADSAYAPAISAAGDCLAYISNKQVFLMDLTAVSMTSTKRTSLLLADLPAGRSIGDFRLDRLQWGSWNAP
ncbi:MAG TPA: hypothetical protein VN653_11455 [Anaerolineales bacterium]|nr:hypothetical protein [Anaerolineales bacterium]